MVFTIGQPSENYIYLTGLLSYSSHVISITLPDTLIWPYHNAHGFYTMPCRDCLSSQVT